LTTALGLRDRGWAPGACVTRVHSLLNSGNAGSYLRSFGPMPARCAERAGRLAAIARSAITAARAFPMVAAGIERARSAASSVTCAAEVGGAVHAAYHQKRARPSLVGSLLRRQQLGGVGHRRFDVELFELLDHARVVNLQSQRGHEASGGIGEVNNLRGLAVR